MKKSLIILIVIAVIAIYFCSYFLTAEKTKPYGMSSDILEKIDIAPVTDDYIIQSYPQSIYTFNNNCEILSTFSCTVISIECYNANGEAIQNDFGYLFDNEMDAAEYFAYINHRADNVNLVNNTTIWFKAETYGHYKQDIVKALNNDLLCADITFISIPFLTYQQKAFIASDHKDKRCKC